MKNIVNFNACAVVFANFNREFLILLSNKNKFVILIINVILESNN